MSQEILAIRIDHTGLRYYTESYHTACYPRTEVSLRKHQTAEENIQSDAQVSNFSGTARARVLTKSVGYEGIIEYMGLPDFLWQRCSECGKAILPYRHIVTYKLTGNTQHVGIDDVIKHYHYYWNMHGVATLETLTVNYPEDSVEVRFWTYESCAGILVHRTAINGVLPTIEAEKGNEDATENKSD